MDDYIILTKSLIKIGLKGGVGCNADQIKALGETFKKGWKKRLVGKKIRKSDYDLFLWLKGVRKKEDREKILLNADNPTESNINQQKKVPRRRAKRKLYKKRYGRKSEYDKLLKHPLWKKKREMILERDKFKCTECGATEDLHIHHLYYYKTKIDPWTYPDDALVTLCQLCHGSWHRNHRNKYKDFPKII